MLAEAQQSGKDLMESQFEEMLKRKYKKKLNDLRVKSEIEI
jgi:hypothetical protein